MIPEIHSVPQIASIALYSPFWNIEFEVAHISINLRRARCSLSNAKLALSFQNFHSFKFISPQGIDPVTSASVEERSTARMHAIKPNTHNRRYRWLISLSMRVTVKCVTVKWYLYGMSGSQVDWSLNSFFLEDWFSEYTAEWNEHSRGTGPAAVRRRTPDVVSTVLSLSFVSTDSSIAKTVRFNI